MPPLPPVADRQALVMEGNPTLIIFLQLILQLQERLLLIYLTLWGRVTARIYTKSHGQVLIHLLRLLLSFQLKTFKA